MEKSLLPIGRRSFQKWLAASLLATQCAPLRGMDRAASGSFDGAVEAVNNFAFQMMRELGRDHSGKNLFFSPLSIEIALMMATEGARGETALEMGKALSFPQSWRSTDSHLPWNTAIMRREMQALFAGYASADTPATQAIRKNIASWRQQLKEANARNQELIKSNDFQTLNKVSEQAKQLADKINEASKTIDQFELRLANSIWFDQTFPIRSTFVTQLKEHYNGALAKRVDFRRQHEKQRAQINQWTSEQTQNRINELIPSGAISENTRMVIANAIYFLGTWSQPFQETATQTAPFHLKDGGKKNVSLMAIQSMTLGKYGAFYSDGRLFETPAVQEPKAPPSFGYPPADGFQIAELPYNGNRLAMTILLPQKAEQIDALAEKVDAAQMSRWAKALAPRSFHVYLPKFKLETSYRLPQMLQRMGMQLAFQPTANGADFSGLCEPQSSQERLFISSIVHKAFVEVNEKGTEAAAATAVLFAPASAAIRAIPFVPIFRADRPFLFAIRDTESGSILFLGRFMEP